MDWLTSGQIAKLIEDENPQAIAVVVARIGKDDPRKAAEVLAGLSAEAQAEAMRRMGSLGDISEWIETSIFKGLRKKYVDR